MRKKILFVDKKILLISQTNRRYCLLSLWPKAKQEPCPFYVCNHALHGKITSTSLPHSGERRRARKHPYDALQDHTSTRSTLLLYVFSVCDDRWIRLSSKQTNASQTHTFWRVPKRLAYTTTIPFCVWCMHAAAYSLCTNCTSFYLSWAKNLEAWAWD